MGFDGTNITEGSERLAEAIGDDSEAVICATGFKPGWSVNFVPLSYLYMYIVHIHALSVVIFMLLSLLIVIHNALRK